MTTTPSEHLQRQATRISRLKKQRYLLELSEDDFRDKVVRPIFLLQGFADGRETCGPFEQGKDCYFTETTEIGGTDVCVVQTKKGRITKASSAKDNLDTVVAQLRTALETGVPLLRDKVKKVPLQAFLVASGEINDSARQHILDQLSNPRLKFVDIETLIPLIDRHLPELWLDIDSDVISYFRLVANAIEQGTELLAGGSGLGHDNNNAGALDGTYASVDVVRAKRKPPLKGRRLPKKTSQPKFDYLPATSLINERERRLFVLGPGGSGKSTVLKRIAYDLVRRELDSPQNVRIPVVLRARDVAEASASSLLDYAVQRIQAFNASLKQPFSADDLTAGRVVLMIDGLDEISAEPQVDALMQLVYDFTSLFPSCQVIMTSRPTPYTMSNAALRSSFAFYNVSQLSLTQVTKMVKSLAKARSLNPEDASEILRQLQDVHGIAISPLIVTIFVAVSDGSRRDIPPNITELFKKYTELMLGRWDEGKKLYQQIQAPVKDLVLRQVALGMHQRRETSMPLEEFRKVVYNELRSRGFIEDTELLYDEIIERSGLFRVESDRIEFRHLLFQEFFAGRAITGPGYIAGVIDDYWWKRAVVFYFGEHPDDIASLTKLAQALDEKKGEARFMAGMAIGVALQACYFAPIEDKALVYARVIRSFVDARGDPEFGGRHAGMPLMLLISCFFSARESLALSNLGLFVERLQNELLETYKEDPAKQDEVRFWFMVALLQSGLYDLAQVYADSFRPRDAALLLALDVELILTEHVRVVSPQARDQIKGLIKLVTDRMRPSAKMLQSRLEHEGRQSEERAGNVEVKRDEAGAAGATLPVDGSENVRG